MRRRIWIGVLMAVLPLAAAIPQPVKTELGAVSGAPSASGAVVAFKGLPFAAPPTGENRWRAPRPAAPWQGVRKADHFSDSCIQLIVQERKPWTYEFMAHNKISEDCLYLNVWTPAKSATARLPVFVWIHGGGMVEGSTAVPVYDGEGLAAKGLVVVTINYRLGVFGFLAHPELTRESDRNASGNYSLLDQVAALEWIKRDIAAFGGDPGNVTIAGQSAGSRSVHCLMASPLAKGLFHRAISESGSGVGRVASKPLTRAEQDGVKFAESKGAKSLAELRAKSWQELTTEPASGPAMRFSTAVDGYFLKVQVDEAVAAGRFQDVPLITGLTTDEGSSAADYGAVPAATWEKQKRESFGAMADEFFRLYPASSPEQLRNSQIESARDQWLVSMFLWAGKRIAAGRSPVYTYYWDHPEPGPDEARYGAFHTSEVPYALHSLSKSDRPWTAADRKIEEMMSSYWANFARSGNPNGKSLPKWEPVRAGARSTMELGDRNGPKPLPEAAKFDFFARYLIQQR